MELIPVVTLEDSLTTGYPLSGPVGPSEHGHQLKIARNLSGSGRFESFSLNLRTFTKNFITPKRFVRY
jgi:hypothetical protein